MLILSRKEGQEILIGGVRVVVVRFQGNQLRLGIEAPPEVKILRGELVEEEEVS